MTITHVFELLTTIFAFVAGIVFFKRLDRFLKLIFFQVAIYLFSDLLAIQVEQNAWIYNLVMPLETLILGVAGLSVVGGRFKNMYLWLFTGFLIIYCWDMFLVSGMSVFAVHSAIAQGIVITALDLAVLYDVFLGKGRGLRKTHIVVATVGMLTYFACSVPYLSLMSYLQSRGQQLNDSIFIIIILPLGWLRYFAVFFAFCLKARTGKQLDVDLLSR